MLQLSTPPRSALAASSHGSQRCQRRRVPEVRWEWHVPAKRVGGGRGKSWPATATPSCPSGASLPQCLCVSPHPSQESCAGPAGMAAGAGGAAASRRAAAPPCGQSGGHAPSPLKNARFGGQHPLCKPQPKQPGVNHGQAGAGIAPWATAPRPRALKTMKGSRTCFSDSGRLLRVQELFTAVSAARLSSATTSGGTMSKSSLPGLQLFATWDSVILLCAPEPGCPKDGRLRTAQPGWLDGVMHPQGSWCGSRLPHAAWVEAP